jgi:hypothetical protein
MITCSKIMPQDGEAKSSPIAAWPVWRMARKVWAFMLNQAHAALPLGTDRLNIPDAASSELWAVTSDFCALADCGSYRNRYRYW